MDAIRKGYAPKRAAAARFANTQASRQYAYNEQYASKRRRTATLGVERKYYDTALAATAIVASTDASGAELDPSATSMISTPAVGDGDQNRDGKRIIIDMVEVKGTVNRIPQEATANPPTAGKVFVALVLDTQSNGAQMNSEDCFKNTGGTALLAAMPLRNLLFGSRFKVLKQEVFDMNYKTLSHFAVDSFSVTGKSCAFSWYVPVKDLQINFNAGTTASIVNVIDNSLHMIAYASDATYQSELSYNARIRFTG